MYGKSRYGFAYYARDSDGGEDGNEYFANLARYVPEFVSEIREMADIYRTEGYEVGRGKYNLENLLSQCFVQTATWGLVRWEEVYGIESNFSLSYEQRREILLAKMRGQGTTTVEMIRTAAVAFSGGEVEVIEDNTNYCFVVRFVGQYGIPRNMQAFKAMLEEIKPAHLGFSFEYRFVTWDELRPYIWDELKPYTWDGIRVKEIHPFVRWNKLLEQSWDILSVYQWQEVKKIKEAET